MRIVWTLCFLIGSGVRSVLGNKLTRVQLEMIQGSTRVNLLHYLMANAILLVSFAQYWFLTGVFPGSLILLLLATAAAGAAMASLFGAMSGVTLPEKRRKIGALAVIYGAQRPKRACALVAVVLLTMVVGAVGALWVFWTNERGTAHARVWIALYQFVLPQVVIIPMLIGNTWPLVTSESLDDDVRNAQLTTGFAGIFHTTVYLLFPFFLLKEEMVAARWALPPFWVLLSIPLLLFLLGSLLPFFVGLYRHRNQAKSLAKWREHWLREVKLSLALPAGEARDQALQDNLQHLKTEITQRFADNETFHYYQELELADMAEEARPLPAPGTSLGAGESGSGTGEDDDEEAASGAEADVALVKPDPDRSQILRARDALRGHLMPSKAAGEDDPQEQIMQIIRENHRNLVDWDIYFAHLEQTLNLYQYVGRWRTDDVSDYVQSRLDNSQAELAVLNKQRNILAGMAISLLSSGLVWMFREFQDELLALVKHLV